MLEKNCKDVESNIFVFTIKKYNQVQRISAFVCGLTLNLWNYTTYSWNLCSYSLDPQVFLKWHVSLWRIIMVSSACEAHRFSQCLKCFFQNACQAVSSNLSHDITFSSSVPSVAVCLAHFVSKYVVQTATSSVSCMLLTVKMYSLLSFCM